MSNTDKELIDAYKLIIDDLSQQVGFDEGVLETVLSALDGRMHELTEVWPFFDIVKQLEDKEDN